MMRKRDKSVLQMKLNIEIIQDYVNNNIISQKVDYINLAVRYPYYEHEKSLACVLLK